MLKKAHNCPSCNNDVACSTGTFLIASVNACPTCGWIAFSHEQATTHSESMAAEMWLLFLDAIGCSTRSDLRSLLNNVKEITSLLTQTKGTVIADPDEVLRAYL